MFAKPLIATGSALSILAFLGTIAAVPAGSTSALPMPAEEDAIYLTRFL